MPASPSTPAVPSTAGATRDDLRNIAIVAHVDHGKTTLVDAMLWQSGAFRANAQVAERVLDSGDLEREKGITILAKNTAVHRDGLTINIIDTPGHADFGGEVERGLAMADGVLLLVDASEGPLPQTRFVLHKTLQARLPVILVINKVDRADARIAEVVDACYELFLDLDATEEQIEFPIVYACARAGRASVSRPGDGTLPDSPDLAPLFSVIAQSIPPPRYDPAAPLRAQVTNTDASSYLGRIALCRVSSGTISRGQQVALCRRDGSLQRVKISELFLTAALDRVPAESAGPGDIIAVAGIPDIMIGETLADPDDPRPLPLIIVDEPAISMTIGVNTSPMAGRQKGTKITARLVSARLERELVGNVSMRVFPTPRPDTWEVQGRGELALAVLVETMRREGYELTVGRPQVVTREISGAVHEPVERLAIDVAEEFFGAVTQLLATRKGHLDAMTNHGTGWVRLEYVVPARGLIGFRTEFLTATRGTGVAHHVFDGYQPWFGTLRTRPSGSLVADRMGAATPYAMFGLQERGSLFVSPGTEVYEGMIVGENSRPGDMDVNICRERKLSNVRQSTGEELERLVPPRLLSLEQALEFCADDECVEVTPSGIRLRKMVLDARDRERTRARAARASGTARPAQGGGGRARSARPAQGGGGRAHTGSPA